MNEWRLNVQERMHFPSGVNTFRAEDEVDEKDADMTWME
jgi:hypothetical protein